MKGSYEPIGIPYLLPYLFNGATYPCTQAESEYFMGGTTLCVCVCVSRRLGYRDFAFDDPPDRKNRQERIETAFASRGDSPVAGLFVVFLHLKLYDERRNQIDEGKQAACLDFTFIGSSERWSAQQL